MKKFISLMLALLMLVFSASALAEAKTVTVQLTADPEVTQNVAMILGARQSDLGSVNAVVALVNALGFKVVAEDNAAQLDITVKDQQLVSLGGVLTDDGVLIGSDLFPSFLFSLSKSTIEDLVKQMMANMPGGGNMDMEAVLGKAAEYVVPFITSVQGAVTAGEPEAVEFEAEGIVFDTKTPQNVDVNAIAEAEKKLVSDLLTDETIAEMLKAFSKDFDAEQAIQQNNEAMSEEHLPNVTVNVYTSSANGNVFFAESEATYKEDTEPSYRFTMLNKGDGTGTVCFYVLKEGLTFTVAYNPKGFMLEVEGNGAYFGLKMNIEQAGTNTDVTTEIYFMNKEKALATVVISVRDGGEITLNLDPAGKQVMAIEDMQNDKIDPSVTSAFASEIQGKIIPLASVLLTAVPEAAPLLQLIMGR